MTSILKDYYSTKSIAQKGRVTWQAASNWVKRGILPDPDLVVDGYQFWSKETVDRVIAEQAAKQRLDKFTSVKKRYPNAVEVQLSEIHK